MTHFEAHATDGDTQSQSASRRNTSGLLHQLQALAPLVGGGFVFISFMLYVFLRVAYYQYYGIFGTSPEEVGLGRIELLSEALTGPVFWTLWRFSWLLVPLAVLTVLAIRAHVKVATISATLMMLAVCVSAAITAYRMVSDAQALGVAAANGVTEELKFYDTLGIRVPVLKIRALPVEVQWISADPKPPVLRERDARCLLYLGRSNGSLIMSNTRTVALTAIPEGKGSVTLLLAPDQLPERCQPLKSRGTP